jgi:hypothetical protein
MERLNSAQEEGEQAALVDMNMAMSVRLAFLACNITLTVLI